MTEPVSVRYIVDDVDTALAFYITHLGFSEVMHPAPTFAAVSRDGLRLLLPADRTRWRRAADARRPPPRARRLEPHPDRRRGSRRDGRSLRAAGAAFRNDIVEGIGGRQILLDDPAGNPIELFQPPRRQG